MPYLFWLLGTVMLCVANWKVGLGAGLLVMSVLQLLVTLCRNQVKSAEAIIPLLNSILSKK
jgi:hypothetical protein